MPSYSFIHLDIDSFTIIYIHILSCIFKYRRMGSYTSISLHIHYYTVILPHTLSHTFIHHHIVSYTFIWAHIHLYAFIYIHIPLWWSTCYFFISKIFPDAGNVRRASFRENARQTFENYRLCMEKSSFQTWFSFPFLRILYCNSEIR